MVKFTIAKCPNCGAEIQVNQDKSTFTCEYCGSTIYANDDVVRAFQKHLKENDEVDNKCVKISQKFNKILELYDGSKNEMLLMLKERVGLVNSNKTVSKYMTMIESKSYVYEPFNDPFTYKIGDRVIDHFEFKRDFSIEVTYDTEDKEFFAIEYYGQITKYTNIDELSSALDTIIEEVKQKFNKE